MTLERISGVYLDGADLLDVARLVKVGVRVVQQRDGITPPARLVRLSRLLDAAVVQHREAITEMLSEPAHVPAQHCSTARAAELLQVSRRQVTRMVRGGVLTGVLTGGAYVLDLLEVEGYAARRMSC